MAQRTGSKRSILPVSPRIDMMGLDSGYGNVKAVFGEQSVMFPSVSARPHHIEFNETEIQLRYPGESVTDPTGEWWVGNLALNQAPKSAHVMLYGRNAVNSDEKGMEFRIRMFIASVAKLNPLSNGDILHLELATGLPVKHMKDAPKMKEMLTRKLKVLTNNADMAVNVEKVYVMPQPYGSIYSQTLNTDGTLNEFYTFKRVGLVDLGRWTVDLLVDDQGEYISAESGTDEVGVWMAQDYIQSALEREFGESVDYAMVEEVIKNRKLLIQGEPKDYSDLVAEAFEPVAEATLSLMHRKWGGALRHEVVFVSGGGAEGVIELIKKAYPHARICPNSQLANARGYLNYARFIARG